MMKNYFVYTFLLLFITNFTLASIPNDFIFKKNKDGSKIFLDELIKQKYIVKNGDEFEIAHEIFDLPNYDEILKPIFDLGINVNDEAFYEDGKYFTLLHKAISMKKEKIALFLIHSGADVNAIDSDGFSPLIYAVINQFKEGVDLLIKNNASLDIEYDYGMSILDFALADVEMLEFLIERGANINKKKFNRNQILFAAVCNKNERAIKILLKHGVDISKEVESFNCAISQVDKSMVELFINNGININAQDRNGKSPLTMAIGMLSSDYCKQLGLEFKKENREKIIEIIELLLKNGANPNDNFDSDRPLWLIVQEMGENKVYDMLIKYGANTEEYYTKLLDLMAEAEKVNLSDLMVY